MSGICRAEEELNKAFEECCKDCSKASRVDSPCFTYQSIRRLKEFGVI